MWGAQIRHAHAARSYTISATNTQTTQGGYIYVDTFNAFRAQQRSLTRISMYSGGGFLRVDVGDAAFDAGVEGVMPEYFRLVGAKVAAGRLLTDEDQALADTGHRVVVITDRLWRRVFGGDSRAVGETLRIDGKPMTIVGVTAAGFFGLEADSGVDIFLPLSTLRSLAGDPKRPIRALNVIGRLSPAATLADAGETFHAAREQVRLDGMTRPAGGEVFSAQRSTPVSTHRCTPKVSPRSVATSLNSVRASPNRRQVRRARRTSASVCASAAAGRAMRGAPECCLIGGGGGIVAALRTRRSSISCCGPYRTSFVAK